jgi:hypothetical protein
VLRSGHGETSPSQASTKSIILEVPNGNATRAEHCSAWYPRRPVCRRGRRSRSRPTRWCRDDEHHWIALADRDFARSNLFVCFWDVLGQSSSRPIVAHDRPAYNWRAEFASDSPLEGDGFELPVPRAKYVRETDSPARAEEAQLLIHAAKTQTRAPRHTGIAPAHPRAT